MKSKAKIAYILSSILLSAPTLFYYLQNKTIFNNQNFIGFGFNPDFITISGTTYCLIYSLLVLILGILTICFSNNHEKYFKDVKNLFLFIGAASIIFIFVLPLCSDMFYYYGNSRMFEHFGISPYSDTLKNFVTNNPTALNDKILSQGASNFWAGYNYPYPPIWLLITSLFTKLSFGNLDICMFITKVVLAILHILNTFLIYKTFKNTSFTIIYGLNPATLLNCVSELHGEIFIVFFMILSLYFLIEKKNILLSIISLGLAASVKFIAILVLPFILLYYFQKLSPLKRFGKCVIYGLLFLGVTAITILPFMNLSQLIGLLSHQQSYFANNFYILLLEFTNIDPHLIKNIIFVFFVIIYIFLCFYWLFKKEIPEEYMLVTSLTILTIFQVLVLAVFRNWYTVWSIPFSNKYPKIFLGWSVLTYILMLISKDTSTLFALLYALSSCLIIVIVVIKNLITKSSINKKRNKGAA